MQCLFCKKTISLLRRLKDAEFCSDDHRKQYVKEQSLLALESLVSDGMRGGARSKNRVAVEVNSAPIRRRIDPINVAEQSQLDANAYSAALEAAHLMATANKGNYGHLEELDETPNDDLLFDALSNINTYEEPLPGPTGDVHGYGVRIGVSTQLHDCIEQPVSAPICSVVVLKTDFVNWSELQAIFSRTPSLALRFRRAGMARLPLCAQGGVLRPIEKRAGVPLTWPTGQTRLPLLDLPVEGELSAPPALVIPPVAAASELIFELMLRTSQHSSISSEQMEGFLCDFHADMLALALAVASPGQLSLMEAIDGPFLSLRAHPNFSEALATAQIGWVPFVLPARQLCGLQETQLRKLTLALQTALDGAVNLRPIEPQSFSPAIVEVEPFPRQVLLGSSELAPFASPLALHQASGLASEWKLDARVLAMVSHPGGSPILSLVPPAIQIGQGSPKVETDSRPTAQRQESFEGSHLQEGLGQVIRLQATRAQSGQTTTLQALPFSGKAWPGKSFLRPSTSSAALQQAERSFILWNLSPKLTGTNLPHEGAASIAFATPKVTISPSRLTIEGVVAVPPPAMASYFGSAVVPSLVASHFNEPLSTSAPLLPSNRQTVPTSVAHTLAFGLRQAAGVGIACAPSSAAVPLPVSLSSPLALCSWVSGTGIPLKSAGPSPDAYLVDRPAVSSDLGAKSCLGLKLTPSVQEAADPIGNDDGFDSLLGWVLPTTAISQLHPSGLPLALTLAIPTSVPLKVDPTAPHAEPISVDHGPALWAALPIVSSKRIYFTIDSSLPVRPPMAGPMSGMVALRLTQPRSLTPPMGFPLGFKAELDPAPVSTFQLTNRNIANFLALPYMDEQASLAPAGPTALSPAELQNLVEHLAATTRVPAIPAHQSEPLVVDGWKAALSNAAQVLPALERTENSASLAAAASAIGAVSWPLVSPLASCAPLSIVQQPLTASASVSAPPRRSTVAMR